MSNTLVGWKRKIKKTHWIKHFEALPQRTKFGPKCKNDSKSHIWNSFFENLISGIQYFYIRPHVPLDIITVFFNFRFSIRKSQSQQNVVKKIIHFTIQFRSKNLTHLTNLNSLGIENKMLLEHRVKPFWLYKFSSKHVSV